MRICQDVCCSATTFCNNDWYSRIPGHGLQDCANGVGSSLEYKKYHRHPMFLLCYVNITVEMTFFYSNGINFCSFKRMCGITTIFLQGLVILTARFFHLFSRDTVFKTGAERDFSSIFVDRTIIHQDEVSMIVIQACALWQHAGGHLVWHHFLSETEHKKLKCVTLSTFSSRRNRW